MTVAWFGWIATAVQTASYFVPSTSMLKKTQAAAACVWLAYGVKMGANPVIVDNLIVGGAALFTALRTRNSTTTSLQFLARPETEPTLSGD